MINPRPADVLINIIANIESKVEPKLTDKDVLSAVATAKHMVRYVINQLKLERTLFLEEIPRISDLLDQTRDFFAGKGGQDAIGQVIAGALDAASTGDNGDVEELAARLMRLREALYQSLDLLIRQRDAYRDDPAYGALRDAIRQYLAWQNEQEARIVAPSFYGRGPRR